MCRGKKSKSSHHNSTGLMQNSIFARGWLIKVCFHYWVLKTFIFITQYWICQTKKNSNAFEIVWYVALSYIIVQSNNYYATYTDLLMKSVGDLSLEHFFLQATSLCQRQFCMLFHLEAPDLSGQGEADVKTWSRMLGYIEFEYLFTDVLAIIALLKVFIPPNTAIIHSTLHSSYPFWRRMMFVIAHHAILHIFCLERFPFDQVLIRT